MGAPGRIWSEVRLGWHGRRLAESGGQLLADRRGQRSDGHREGMYGHQFQDNAGRGLAGVNSGGSGPACDALIDHRNALIDAVPFCRAGYSGFGTPITAPEIVIWSSAG